MKRAWDARFNIIVKQLRNEKVSCAIGKQFLPPGRPGVPETRRGVMIPRFGVLIMHQPRQRAEL